MSGRFLSNQMRVNCTRRRNFRKADAWIDEQRAKATPKKPLAAATQNNWHIKISMYVVLVWSKSTDVAFKCVHNGRYGFLLTWQEHATGPILALYVTSLGIDEQEKRPLGQTMAFVTSDAAVFFTPRVRSTQPGLKNIFVFRRISSLLDCVLFFFFLNLLLPLPTVPRRNHWSHVSHLRVCYYSCLYNFLFRY